MHAFTHVGATEAAARVGGRWTAHIITQTYNITHTHTQSTQRESRTDIHTRHTLTYTYTHSGMHTDTE